MIYYNLHLGLISTLFILISIFQVSGQTYHITGTVLRASDNAKVSAATVMVLSPRDTSLIKGDITGDSGAFLIEGIKRGSYLLGVQYIGYETLEKRIEVVDSDLDVGSLIISETATWLNDVVVGARRSTGTQMGDTTQYDAAAFKTLKDASAQSLIEKLPGVNQDGGNLQAEGENVVQILVDGKPFFGQDVRTALQNLPAEVIESVQIYDRQSDKAEMSGFDDGELEKTINIITKPNRRRGIFGKLSGGAGNDDRYLAGASLNFFNEERRVTLTGLSNNINALNYSADPNSQGETRPQNGIIKTNSGGINFVDTWAEKIEVSGSYLYRSRENVGNDFLIREYVLPSSEGQIYRENGESFQLNQDHLVRMRFVYRLDKRNRLIFRPHASIRNDQEESNFFGRTTVGNDPVNQTENQREAENKDFDLGGRLFYSHRFLKKGRSITLGLNAGNSTNEDQADRVAENTFFTEDIRTEILNQYITRDRTGSNWEADISYTEPVGKKGQIELEYEIGDNVDKSDRITFDVLDAMDPTEYRPDTFLSNTFESDYLSQEIELGYQYRSDKFRIQMELENRNTRLKNDQQFPQPFFLERTFNNIAPTVRIDFQFTKTKRLDLDYDTYNRTPNIGQLQDVIDISNPLHLRTGSPDLEQAFTHRLRARFRSRNPENDQSFYLYLSGSTTEDYITNGSTIAERSMILEEGIILEKGSQLTRPVNLDGYWDVRSYVNYGIPLEFIKSNGSFFGGVNFTRRPGLINEEINFSASSNFRAGLTVSSNINDQIDFQFSTRSSYNLVNNSVRSSLNNNYFSQSSRFRFDWVWNKLVYRMNVNHRFNNGLAEDLDRSFILLNMSIGTKFMKNDLGELSVSVYDLLRQNNNISRSVNELYIEDSESNVLQRYFMLTFNYNLRHFNRGTTEDDYNKLHGGSE